MASSEAPSSSEVAQPSSSASPSSSAFQYAFRAEKTQGMVACQPVWSSMPTFQKPDGASRTACYSPDGSLYAVASVSGIYIYDVTSPDEVRLVKELPVKGAIEISFSPKGTYLSTWIRPIKLDDNSQHKNLQVWSTTAAASDASAESEETEVIAFTQKSLDGWKLQYTEDEQFALRSIQNEVHILDTTREFTLVDKLRIEGLSSFSLGPGRNPSIAVFISEKKGMPGAVRVYSLSTLASPSIQKSFFKADRGQMKWNSSGTSLLFLSSTDHDKTGKSYYGETNLYLLTPALQYVAQVTLDKEGGIGDFAWNPANGGKEFAVSYGFVPAKTTLFDLRLNVLHDFGSHPRNFVSFNPQGRLLCIAGFGNLAGQVDIWDRSTLKKVANFQASNCTECTWSPDGRFMMMSTLSPRLRVDNGVKIHHWSGELIHADLIEECYQAAWRPVPSTGFSFPRALSPAPQPSRNVQLLNAQKLAARGTDGSTTPKPVATGAYRPPGLRNREVPSIFKREDEGGALYAPPAKQEGGARGVPGMTPRQENGTPGRGSRGRIVPGAAPPADGQGKQGNNQKKNGQSNRNKGNKNRENGQESGVSSPTKEMASLNMDATPSSNGHASAPTANGAVPAQETAAPAGSGPLSPEDKKRRALQKKLGAIDALKALKAEGKKLEKTQEKKIEAEAEIRKELQDLGN